MKTGRMSALLLATVMLLTCLTGCGKTNSDDITNSINGANSTDETLSDNGRSGSGSQQADINPAMGRYVEEVTDFPEDIISGYGNRLHKLSDGRIIISDSVRPFLVSDDNGATWEEDDREWYTRMLSNLCFIREIAVGADNTAAVIYSEALYDGDDGENKFIEYGNTKLLVVRPDGAENLIDIPVSGDDKYPHYVGMADDGRIFVSISNCSDIYEVKENGSCEYFMTVQGECPEFMQFQGNLMFLDGHDYEHILIYDMEKKEYLDDEVLTDFIKENYPDGNSYGGSGTYQMYFFTGEEGVIYIAGEKGLHRHVIGGSAMEQIIDGSRCTFTNPSYEIAGMVMLEDNTFLTLFSNARLARYVYDPDVVTVPDDRLKVYSLKENDTIRQAVALYQKAYPDIAVEYEIGMEADGSVTREDAIKSLNTKIMSGEGPDVLILDDMPIDSYVDKGILMDLSTILDSLNGEEEVFDSVVRAMKKDEKVNAIPCEIQIPVMMGAEKYISQLKDFESMADMMEELRADNPGKDLLGICTEKGIMRYFAMSCVPAWTTESGELDREAVTQFLEQTKRIYDAQTDGLPEETIEEYKVINELWKGNFGEYKDDSAILRAADNGHDYAGGKIQLTYSALSGVFAYDKMISINEAEGFEDCKWTVMNGQSSNVFCAKTLLGINAASENPGLAEDFLRLCLGSKNQSNLFYGFAVNKAAFDKNFVPHPVDPDGKYAFFVINNEEGIEIIINVYRSNEEQIADLRKCIEAADTPYIEDTVLENVVYEEGILYMQGTQSLEEAVNAIERKISIYMAE